MIETKNQIVIPNDTEILVVSDIHIRTDEDSKAKLFRNLMQASSNCQSLQKIILLGDIFDFFFGDKIYFYQKFQNVFSCLNSVCNAGKEIYFFEGNHEFSMSSRNIDIPKNFKVIAEGSEIFSLQNGIKIIFSHGDLVYFDKPYQNFRNFVKSPMVRKLANLIPAVVLDRYALFHANHSRANEKALDTRSLIECCREWLKKNHVQKGILGHFHHEINHQYTDGAELHCMRSWEEPSFLSISFEGTIKHHYLKNYI